MGERLTPFMLFFCEEKSAVQAVHPQLAPHEVSALIAEKWKTLSPEKSRAYSVLSATYAEQKKTALTNPKKRKERREKDPKAPKSATSAYMYFSKHHRMLLKQENSDLTFGDLGKTVGAMWNAASPEEKKPFEDLAAEDKTRYTTELVDYKSCVETQAAAPLPPDTAAAAVMVASPAARPPSRVGPPPPIPTPLAALSRSPLVSPAVPAVPPPPLPSYGVLL